MHISGSHYSRNIDDSRTTANLPSLSFLPVRFQDRYALEQPDHDSPPIIFFADNGIFPEVDDGLLAA
jgi:hypothetical protein